MSELNIVTANIQKAAFDGSEYDAVAEQLAGDLERHSNADAILLMEATRGTRGLHPTVEEYFRDSGLVTVSFPRSPEISEDPPADRAGRSVNNVLAYRRSLRPPSIVSHGPRNFAELRDGSRVATLGHLSDWHESQRERIVASYLGEVALREDTIVTEVLMGDINSNDSRYHRPVVHGAMRQLGQAASRLVPGVVETGPVKGNYLNRAAHISRRMWEMLDSQTLDQLQKAGFVSALESQATLLVGRTGLLMVDNVLHRGGEVAADTAPPMAASDHRTLTATIR